MYTAKPISVHTFSEKKEILNGRVVNDTAVNTAYDGNVLHVVKRENNKLSHFDIKDNNLKKLLKAPTSNIGLLERLSQHTKHKHTKHKRSQHKRSQHKRSQHKRSQHKRSQHKRTKLSHFNSVSDKEF
jgi:hypothetical protein